VSGAAGSATRGALCPEPAFGEFPFTAEDFDRIAALLEREVGIHLLRSKSALVYSRLAKRLRARGLRSFRDYCALVDEGRDLDERRHMVAALTTNLTRFFREPHHFDHLRRHALPPLLDAARQGARVRLWSAGCSSGQEPYSIALTVLSLMPDAASFDVKVLATDVNPQVVAEGRRGIYDEAQLHDVPAELKRRWFAPVSGEPSRSWRVADELSHLVAFRELNLVGGWPMRGTFEVIFCRNVVIYFGEAVQAQIWARLAEALSPEGWLYIGHSERIAGGLAGALSPAGTTTYRLRGKGRS
jgi:chemotaxis protein methyltransferase CheR